MTHQGKVWKLANAEFENIVKKSSSFSDARKKIYGVSGNIKSVRDRCSSLNLDISHFSNCKRNTIV